MSRVIALAFNTFEVRKVEFPSFSNVFRAMTKLHADAAPLLSANDSIRSSARNWLM